MDENGTALVEKILKDIHGIMTKTDLISFEIVPISCNVENKSPVLEAEDCLGLESWCVKHVYMYCYSELSNNYLFKFSQKKMPKVFSTDLDRLMKLLNVTLLLNPDVTSFWNIRRELVQRTQLTRTSELKFSGLVLTWKPKCNDAFSYRKWLLDFIFNDGSNNDELEYIIAEEVHICKMTAEKSPNNYHGWTHRLWLLNNVKKLKQTHFFINYLIAEYKVVRSVSDYSCLNYRQTVIKNILSLNTEADWNLYELNTPVDLTDGFIEYMYDIKNNSVDSVPRITKKDLFGDKALDFLLGDTSHCKCDLRTEVVCKQLSFLFTELFATSEWLLYFKHHEASWYHRRFVAHEILAAIYKYFGLRRENKAFYKVPCSACSSEPTNQKQAKIEENDRLFSTVLYKYFVAGEKMFLKRYRIDGDSYFAKGYEKYLLVIEGLSVTSLCSGKRLVN